MRLPCEPVVLAVNSTVSVVNLVVSGVEMLTDATAISLERAGGSIDSGDKNTPDKTTPRAEPMLSPFLKRSFSFGKLGRSLRAVLTL